MIIIFLLFLLLCLIHHILTRNFDYWRKRNVKYPIPTPILGNYGDYILLKKYIGEVAQEICQKFPKEPYIGTFYGSEPSLIVQDPKLIKLITAKEFYYFNGRDISQYTGKELATRNMFAYGGDQWKIFRQNITPLFSPAKMKNMFYLIEKCALDFEKLLDDETQKSYVIEARRALMARFTIECISSCVFGVEVNSMDHDYKNNPFTKITDAVFTSSKIIGFKLAARSVWPRFFYGLGLKTFSTKVDEFFYTFLTKVFKTRYYQPSPRKDFIDLLLNLKQNEYIVGDSISNTKTGSDNKIKLHVTDEVLVSQCALFFFGGFESSAATMSFTLYELAKNLQAQQKVHAEVDQFLLRHSNKLTYDCVNDLPYLEACINEALRLYPIQGIITREVMDDYILPTGVHLNKGVRIHIPIYHLHHHPDFFPDPEVYRPERFYLEEKKNIRPQTFMPFGEGSRVCIGTRFAKMQVLAGLVTVFKKYRVELAATTPRRLRLDPCTVVTAPVEPILLKFNARKGWEQRVYDR